VADYLFGYDFFISYAHDDGLKYPQALADELQKMGYTVFLDTRIYVVGIDLKAATRRRIRMSHKVVVIARPQALVSDWVRREVQTCLELARTPIVVDVNRTLAEAPDDLAVKRLLKDKLYIAESVADPDSQPTAHVLEKLRRSFRATRQETLRLRILSLAASVLVLLAAATTWQWFQAERQRAIAEDRGRVSLSRLLVTQSKEYLDEQPDLALLLAAESVQLNRSAESLGSLLTGLLQFPYLSTRLHDLRDHLRAKRFSLDGRRVAEGTLSDIAFSPDGKFLAAISDSETMLWSCDDWTHVETLMGSAYDPSGVRVVEFSSDGMSLAAVRGGSIELWDLEERIQLSDKLQGPQKYVWSIAFSPDNKSFITVGNKVDIVIWDLATRKPVQELEGHDANVVTVEFNPSGSLFATGSWDNTIRLWDASSLQPAGKALKGHTRGVNDIVFTNDGKQLISGGDDGTIRVWDVEKEQPVGDAISLPFGGRVAEVAMSSDGAFLVSRSYEDGTRLWNLANPETNVRVSYWKPNEMYSVVFHPNDGLFASGYKDGAIAIWDISKDLQMKVTAPQFEDPYITRLTFSPDGELLAGGGFEGSIVLWNVNTWKRVMLANPLPVDGEGDTVTCMAFSSSGQILASGSVTGAIRLWNAQSRISLKDPVWPAHKGNVSSIAFSPEGDLMASGSLDGSLIIWDLAKLSHAVDPITENHGSLNSLSFSPKDPLLVAGYEDGTLVIFDVSQRPPIKHVKPGAHRGNIQKVIFSPDGLLLTIGRDDGTIKFWDIETMRPLEEMIKIDDDVVRNAIVSSAQEEILVVSTSDGVRLCDLATKQLIGDTIPVMHEDLALSSDGRLALARAENSIMILDLTINAWLSRACGIANRNLDNDEKRRFLGQEDYRNTCPQRRIKEELRKARLPE
jgi:WD40 repeat protein